MRAAVMSGGRLRRHLAVALVFVGLVAAAPGVASLAGFTATDVNRDNVISTGALDIAFGQDTRYVSIANMKPGDWLDQTVAVTNTGTLASDYTFGATNLRVRAGANLDEVLRVTVSRGGEVLADGVRLSGIANVTGRLEPTATDLLEIRISWPENAPEIDNRYQGAALDLDLLVRATQLATSTTVPATTTTAVPTTTTVPVTTTSVPGGPAINGVPGLTSIEVPFDPTATSLTEATAASTRFDVVNTSGSALSFRFEATGLTEILDGNGGWLGTAYTPEWGWDGLLRVDLAPGESRSFIANPWDATTTLSVVAIG